MLFSKIIYLFIKFMTKMGFNVIGLHASFSKIIIYHIYVYFRFLHISIKYSEFEL